MAPGWAAACAAVFLCLSAASCRLTAVGRLQGRGCSCGVRQRLLYAAHGQPGGGGQATQGWLHLATGSGRQVASASGR